MGLKSYTLRLDEDVYESIKKHLSESGDPDLTISFVIRRYLIDLNNAIPDLKKSQFSLFNHITFISTLFKNFDRLANFEGMLKGSYNVELAEKKAAEKEGKK